MTKRSNPFIEDFVPQSKTHVGLKQFNNNEERMQKVYEKTLEMLYKGAKKSPNKVIKSLDAMPSLSIKKDSMKQLLLNKDGTLGSKKIEELYKHPSVQECGCSCMQVETQCTFCEVPLCNTCNLLCSRCYLPYCTKCSLYSSEGTEICVSCYG